MSGASFRCAVVSDVYGDTVALDAVLEDARRAGVDDTATAIEHRRVPYEIDAVIAQLERVRHPFRDYLAAHFLWLVTHSRRL